MTDRSYIPALASIKMRYDRKPETGTPDPFLTKVKTLVKRDYGGLSNVDRRLVVRDAIRRHKEGVNLALAVTLAAMEYRGQRARKLR